MDRRKIQNIEGADIGSSDDFEKDINELIEFRKTQEKERTYNVQDVVNSQKVNQTLLDNVD